jgi:hypothetical protein
MVAAIKYIVIDFNWLWILLGERCRTKIGGGLSLAGDSALVQLA